MNKFNKFCCQTCGKPLIVGDYRSSYDYVTLNEKGEAMYGLETGKCNNEGMEILCSAGCKTPITHLSTDEINTLGDVLNNAS